MARSPTPSDRTERRKRRQRHLLNHLIAYFAVMVVLIPVNRFLTPEDPWVLVPLVAWGAPLAIHVAWVMELFGSPGGDDDTAPR